MKHNTNTRSSRSFERSMIAADTKRSDSPVLTALLAVSSLLALPIVFTLVLSTWSDSVSRQIVASTGLLTLLGFTFLRRKYEMLLLALIFFSQFAVSLHTFPLQEPVKLQVFFSDILYLLFFCAALERRGRWWPDAVGWLFILFIGWIAVATFYSVHVQQSLVFLLWQIKYLFLYLFVRQVRMDESLLSWLLYAVVAILVMQCVVSLAQVWTGHWLGLEILGERNVDSLKNYLVKGSLRVCGTLGATNAFGAYMAALIILLLPFMTMRFNAAHVAGALLGLAAVIVCLSRAAWLSLLIGSLAVILAMLRAGLISVSRVVLLGIVALVALGAGIGVYYDKIVDRFQDRQAISSAEGRLAQIAEAWKVIEKYQATGIGPGVTQFFGRWRQDSHFVRDKLPGVSMMNQVHSSQLQIWIETGLTGFVLFLAIIFSTFGSIVRPSTPGSGEPRSLMLLRIGSACATFAIMIDASFGMELNHPQLFTLFWILFALSRLGGPAVLSQTQAVKTTSIPVAARILD
jgi:O-antigen ligase